MTLPPDTWDHILKCPAYYDTPTAQAARDRTSSSSPTAPMRAGSLFLAISTALGAQALDVHIFHRPFHPSAPPPAFRPRASLTVSSGRPPVLDNSPSLAQDLVEFATAFTGLDSLSGDALYQIALQHGNDRWSISSVKLCHMPHVTDETFHLHLTERPDPDLFALDYFVSPVAQDGSCHKTTSENDKTTDFLSSLKSLAVNLPQANSTIVLHRPKVPPVPELRKPPPVTPEGESVKPLPEKSFLQKYWIYIVGLMLVLLLSGGPDDEVLRSQ